MPTRWSITAVDDILGKDLLKTTKTFPLINEFRVYDWDQLDNRWSVMLTPTSWRYELIEAWYPNTVWNPHGPAGGDHILARVLSTAARITRRSAAAITPPGLAVNELLQREKPAVGGGHIPGGAPWLPSAGRRVERPGERAHGADAKTAQVQHSWNRPWRTYRPGWTSRSPPGWTTARC